MKSIGIFSAVLLALFAATNALQCEPLICRMMCEDGYEVDAEGCPLCMCRETPDVCVEPIENYSCGALNNQECPSTHECRFSFLGVVGECCLKSSGSSTTQAGKASVETSTSRLLKRSAAFSTSKAGTALSTARPATRATGRSTSRLLKRSAAFSTSKAGTGLSTARPATRATGRSTSRFQKRSGQDTSSSTPTTQGSVTTGQSAGPSTSTQY